MILVDTSALLDFLDRDAPRHAELGATFGEVLGAGQAVVHDHVVIEAEALVRRRHGPEAGRRLLDVIDAMELRFVDAELFGEAVAAHRAATRRSSLVDQVSFALMRAEAITTAITLDEDFAREGFELLPA